LEALDWVWISVPGVEAEEVVGVIAEVVVTGAVVAAILGAEATLAGVILEEEGQVEEIRNQAQVLVTCQV